MRVIGNRKEWAPGLRWPTPDEIRWTHDSDQDVFIYRKKGVIRYRNHQQADADVREMIADADAMARKARKLSRWSS